MHWRASTPVPTGNGAGNGLPGREDLLSRDDLSTGVKRVQQEKAVLRPIIETWLRERTVREASRVLLEFDVPASPILDVDSSVLREQAAVRGLTREVDAPDGARITLVQSPVRMSTAHREEFGLPHALGEDTGRVLKEWIGMNDDEIARLRAQGITG